MAKEKEARDSDIQTKKDKNFKRNTINKYVSKLSDENDLQIITKDKAYICSGKFVQHFKKLRGSKNTKFLDDNFKTVWGKFDEQHKNFI